MSRPIRLATRAIILRDNRLLMVNAWAEGSDLLCAPGGGAEPNSSMPDNLAREVYEETGLTVHIGAPCLLNEYHDPDRGFHQVEVFFRTTITDGDPFGEWEDPEGVVSERHWLTRAELMNRNFRPRSLPAVAWGDADAPAYDPLELIAR